MNQKLVLPISMAALALVVLAACGGDDELTLDVYFAEIQVMDDEFEERTSAIEFGGDSETDEDAIRDSRVPIASTADILRDFVNDLDTMTPPALAAEQHEESVQAGRDLVQTYVDLLDTLLVAETIKEFGDLMVENNDLGPAVRRFQASCDSLVEVAVENGITVDFNCGG